MPFTFNWAAYSPWRSPILVISAFAVTFNGSSPVGVTLNVCEFEFDIFLVMLLLFVLASLIRYF